MKTELTITKEKVLEAASKCSTANATLRVLFPEAFEVEFKPAKIKLEIDNPEDLKSFRIWLGGISSNTTVFQKLLDDYPFLNDY